MSDDNDGVLVLIHCKVVDGDSDPCICSLQGDELGIEGWTSRGLWRTVQMSSVFFVFQAEWRSLTRK